MPLVIPIVQKSGAIGYHNPGEPQGMGQMTPQEANQAVGVYLPPEYIEAITQRESLAAGAMLRERKINRKKRALDVKENLKALARHQGEEQRIRDRQQGPPIDPRFLGTRPMAMNPDTHYSGGSWDFDARRPIYTRGSGKSPEEIAAFTAYKKRNSPFGPPSLPSSISYEEEED